MMDDVRFDRLARGLSERRSRRGVLGAFALAATALIARRGAASAQAGTPGGMCGGVAGIQCPDGYICVDNPGDGCDPNAGGFDCAGTCLPADTDPCAAMTCAEGTTCCPECGGLCIPAHIECTSELCTSQPCNQATCGPGEYCCNHSCSRCVPLGRGCTREYCRPNQSGGERCGVNTCAPGEFCCNPSCGICAPVGGSCIEIACEPEGRSGERCGPTICPEGEVCCNESCGICTPPGGACIALYCGASQ